MKPKTTLILFAVFMVLLSLILIFDTKDKEGDSSTKLALIPSDEITGFDFKTEENLISLKKNDQDQWTLSSPLIREVDQTEADNFLKEFSNLDFTRVVEENPSDLSKYGIPNKEVTLFSQKSTSPLKILIGIENPLDQSYFAKRSNENRVVLIPDTKKALLEKKFFDFRKKDIFSFETGDVGKIKITTHSFSWEVQKKEDEWWLTTPLKALGDENKINSLLISLAGLKAKEFIEEEKNKDLLEKYKLNKPDYKMALYFPASNQETIFNLQKQKEDLIVSSSLSSFIIKVDNKILSDLDKNPQEFRNKNVADFNSWDVDKISIKTSNLELSASKNNKDEWILKTESGNTKADGSKIDSLIRSLNNLEVQSFIDPPFDLKNYKLNDPLAIITIQTKNNSKPGKEMILSIGKLTGTESQTIVMKNKQFEYLFNISGEFMNNLPSSKDEWLYKETKIEKKTDIDNKS